jgi:hypothetical protein
MKRTDKTFFILAIELIATLSCSRHGTEHTITTGSLLNEMVDLGRLTRLPEQGYKTVLIPVKKQELILFG